MILDTATRSSRRLVARERCLVIAVLCTWGIAVVMGAGALLRYERTPGLSPVLSRWPAGVSLPLDPQGRTLVVVVHPRCPCTRTTLRMLREVATGLRAPTTLHALVFEPRQNPAPWDIADTTG